MAWKKQYSKYKAQKTSINGITFDSKKEAGRYQELCVLEKAGIIRNLRLQVKYVLIPAQREPDTIGPRGGRKQGKLIEHEVSYIADFVYEENGQTVVEDTKGVKTPEYIIKRKLMLWVHGIRVKEV